MRNVTLAYEPLTEHLNYTYPTSGEEHATTFVQTLFAGARMA